MEISEEIEKIKERNKKVEQDKLWEISFIRRICIGILTYIVILIYSYTIFKINNVFFSSLIPVIGFGLSTLSLKLIRKLWKKRKKRQRT